MEIRIPFKTKDSWEYTMSDGMEAIIEGNKIIVREKESKDERIAEELIKALRGISTGLQYAIFLTEEKKQRWLAWLEKQKETLKSANSISSDCWHKVADSFPDSTRVDACKQKPAEIDEYKIIKKHITKDVLSSEVYKRLKECGWFKECGWYVTDEKPVDDKAFEEWLNDQYNVHHRDGYITMDEREFKNWSRKIWNMYQQNPIECTSDSALQKIKASMANWRALSEHFKGKKENFYQYYGGKADGLQIALNYLGNGNEQPLEEYTPDSVKFDEGFKAGREVGFREGVESVKPVEWSEEDSDNLERVDNYLLMLDDYVRNDWSTPQVKTDKIRGNIQVILSPWLKYLPERLSLRPKQEWSEDDKRILEETVGMIEARGCWVRSDDAVKQVLNFLKSLPERFSLQTKKEWSEEDSIGWDNEEELQNVVTAKKMAQEN